MAGDITTPTQVERPRQEDASQHTRPQAPLSPTNPDKQRANKRRKDANVQAPPHIDLTGKGAARQPESVAINTLGPQLNDMLRKATATKAVVSRFATLLDEFVASYEGDQLTEHKAMAKEIVNISITNLNTTIFAATGGHVYAPVQLESSSGRKSTAQTSSGPLKTVSWADIAQGHSSSSSGRVFSMSGNSSGGAPTANPTRVQARPTNKPSQPPYRPFKTPREDLRVLVRLPEIARPNMAKSSPLALRQEMMTRYGLTLADVPEIAPTRAGWAIRPATREIRDQLLEKAQDIALWMGAEHVGLPETWYTYAVPEVPLEQRSYDGSLIATQDLISDEVYAQTRIRPVDIKQSRHGVDPRTSRCTWIVSFLQPVRGFRLFGVSGFSRPITKKVPIELHNPGCQGYCNNRRCHKVARCNNCSQRLDEHPEIDGKCDKPAKCINCHGPFPAGHEHCPAAPRRVKGEVKRPTQQQLKAIRQRGSQKYAKQNVATAATSDTESSEEPSATAAIPASEPVILLDAEDIVMDEDQSVQTCTTKEIRARKVIEPSAKRRRASSQPLQATRDAEGTDALSSSAPAALTTPVTPTPESRGASATQPTRATITRGARSLMPSSSAPTQVLRARPNYNEVNMFSSTFGHHGTPDDYESESDEI